MIGYTTYLLLFLTGTLPVVMVTSFLSNADDASALRDLPRRAAVFVGSCVALAVVLGAIGVYLH